MLSNGKNVTNTSIAGCLKLLPCNRQLQISSEKDAFYKILHVVNILRESFTYFAKFQNGRYSKHEHVIKFQNCSPEKGIGGIKLAIN